MFNVYVLCLSLKNGDTVFSKTYSSFNKAKDKISVFVENYYNERGKKLVQVDEEELEKLKGTIKKGDKNVYMQKRPSEAILYKLGIDEGWVKNSYLLEKIGQIGVSELAVKVPSVYLADDEIEESDSDDFELVPVSKITNYEHGTHVHFISELKNVLSNKKNRELNIPETVVDNSKMENFISDLVNQKNRLNHVSPPTLKLHLVDDEQFHDFESSNNCL